MCKNGTYCGDGGYLNEPCRRDTIRRQPLRRTVVPAGVGEFTLGVAFGDPADILELAELERKEMAEKRRENPPVVYRRMGGDPRQHHHGPGCSPGCVTVYAV